MRKNRCIAAVCLLALLVCGAIPAQAAVFTSDVRVLISIGGPTTFTFTPVGEFTLREAPDVAVGNDEITISAVGGRVSVTLGSETITAASLTFLSGDYGGLTDYIRLKNSVHSTCTYLGNMTFDVSENALRAINELPLERYLYGVVPNEMSNSFPLDALKAQAVCARGYAVANATNNSRGAYDLLDTSQDQVYKGYASRNTRAIAAVDLTRGQVLTYDGDIIETYYAASNGGQTEKTGNVWSTDFPYYVNLDDAYDLLNASSLEEKSFIPEVYTEETLALMDRLVLLDIERAAYEKAGQPVTLLCTISVTPKSPQYDPPSRCYTEADVTLAVAYEEGGEEKTGQLTITLTLEDLHFGSFENTLGRASASKTRLRMRGAERGVCYSGGAAHSGWYLTERRYGHGVGMSQRGAQERARSGQSYTDILAFYYMDTALNAVGTYESAPKITSEEYKVREWGLSGIAPGTTPAELLSRLSSEGTLSVVTSKGFEAKQDVFTGYFVRVTYDGGTTFFDLPIVIYGDLDGNGTVDADDIAALQGHLVHAMPLTGARLSAADVNHDGGADLLDLLHLIRHVNGDEKLSQRS